MSDKQIKNSSAFVDIVDQVIDAYEGIPNVMNRFNYKHSMGVYIWKRRGIPKSLLADIHIDTGIPLKTLQKANPKKTEMFVDG